MTRIATDWPALFKQHPTANDVEMAAILGCTPQTVKAHRCVLGLPRRYNKRPSIATREKPVQVWTRCTEDDKATIEAAAREAGVTVSAWILSTVRASLAATQARMGVVLDRAHEASGVVVKK